MIKSLIDPDRGFAEPEVVGIGTEQPIDPVATCEVWRQRCHLLGGLFSGHGILFQVAA